MLIDFLLRQRCQVLPFLGTQGGEDRYGESQERRCRLQEAQRLENPGGAPGVRDDIPARAMMFCTGDMIPPRSVVTCEGRRYVVTGCVRARGFAEEHLEVTLQ